MELRDNGSGLLQIRRSKTDPEGEGVILYVGREAAQDLVKSGVELPGLMTAGRWQSSKLPARYTERQAARGG